MQIGEPPGGHSMSNQQGFGSMVANLADFYFMRSPNIEDNILYFKLIGF